VAIAYFDSSAFVKLVVAEDAGATAAALWDACELTLSSRLAYPEVRAALAAAARDRRLTHARLRRAVSDWEEFWAATRPVELTPAVERSAGVLAAEHALCGADAVHLASALALRTAVIVVTWDERLRSGVRAAGLALAPAELGRP
jgi:hypothetical protein